MNKNTEEFKFQVAGPYNPIKFPYLWGNPPAVATLSTALDIAHTYYSILMWRQSGEAMAESMRHVATMMGEVDDQSETEKTYSPLGYAGLFAIIFVFSVISVHDHRKNSKLSDCVKEAAIPVVLQMLFALTNDEAVAEYARYRRTGYLGRPSDGDRARIQEFKEFVRKIARRSEEINEHFLRNQYDIPLQTRLYGYDRERGHYWSQPIEMPVIECDEDDY